MKPEIVLLVDGKAVDTISFGVVPAGTTRKLDVTVLNKGTVKVTNLKFDIGSPEIKIISQPSDLNINQEGKLSLEYNPSETAEKGLDVQLKVEGKYVV